jgi:iron uptake system component EfeO
MTSRRWLAATTSVLAAALVLGACGSSGGSAGGTSADGSPASPSTGASPVSNGGTGQPAKVMITLTAEGCQPKPASVSAGPVEFTVQNDNAAAVTEAELKSGDLAHIFGEKENLTPGLSGAFSATLQPGRYKIQCPGAAAQTWEFVVTGKATEPAWESKPDLVRAVSLYTAFVDSSTKLLLRSTSSFCFAVKAGNRALAQQRYPQARVFYEQIEPVAEVFGDLDTQIDGRWQNPVTKKSQFMGFHRLEQILWDEPSMTGATALCQGLMEHEEKLVALVSKAEYSPQEMAAGATDLINEAAQNKITGEEERYSHIDLVDFDANMKASMKVASLLAPYLQTVDPDLVSLIQRRNDEVQRLLTRYQSQPGYEHTGYVNYTTVTKAERRALSGVVNAFAEALSGMSAKVS